MRRERGKEVCRDAVPVSWKERVEIELRHGVTRVNYTYQSLRGLPHGAWQAPHVSPWHKRSQWWKPQASNLMYHKNNNRLAKFKWHVGEVGLTTHFPHVVPHDTFSCEHRTLSTIFLPQAHCLLVRYGHGGQRDGSSWHACDVFRCPHCGGGREQA